MFGISSFFVIQVVFLYFRDMALPSFIILLRMFGIPFLFVGYVLYQVVVRKKRWPAIKNDVFVSLFFIAVYIGLYFAVT